MKLQRLSIFLLVSAASANGNNSHLDSHSVLSNKSELIAAHFQDKASFKGFEPLKGAYELDEQYQILEGDDARKSQAKEVASELNKKSKFNNNNNNNNTNNRNLITTGHLADLILEDCAAGHVYKDTDYDDEYMPICGCIYNEQINEVVMECYLGDEECTAPAQGETVNDTTCIGTHELFFFSDKDGDLSNKLTCQVCRSENCDGIKETCVEVAFDNQNEPVACQVIQLPTDENDEVQVCEICGICDDDGVTKGVEHSCFGIPTNGCDTEAYAHLHNFASQPTGGSPIPGIFGEVCEMESPDRALYELVTYAAGYTTQCDCDDPATPAIECDLYDERCHANLCTDISERFFFNDETGDYEAKWTVNWNTGFWTQTIFDSNGAATSCSVIGNDPSSGGLLQCNRCSICGTMLGAGIQYDCFGRQQESDCDPSEGRAINNFGGATALQQSKSQAANESGDSNLLPAVLGALFGGMALAFIVVLVVRQRNPAPAPAAGNDDMTVDESVAPSVAAGNPPEEPEFAIGDLEGVQVPPATITTENEEELKPTDSGVMT